MTTTGERYAIAQGFLTALRNRDWDLMRSLMTKEITWTLPGESLISGEARGVDAVIERAERIVSYRLNFGLEYVLYGLEGFALALHNTAERDSLLLEEHLATVCHLSGQRISGITTYLSDVDMVKAFFVSNL
jgi:ketosteroid isomerase-like protein